MRTICKKKEEKKMLLYTYKYLKKKKKTGIKPGNLEYIPPEPTR